MKESVYSNDGVKILPGRRVGNTTRICDNAIQQLFSGKKVIICDHHFSMVSTIKLMEMILRTLSLMHNISGSEDLEIANIGRTFSIEYKWVDESGNITEKW